MKSRLMVAAVGVPVLLYIVLWGPEWVIALALTALSGVGAYELMKCVGAVESSRMLCQIGRASCRERV